MDLHVNAGYRAFSTGDARFDGRLLGGVRTTRMYCRPVGIRPPGEMLPRQRCALNEISVFNPRGKA